MGHFLWICILSLVRRFGIGRSLSAWMMDEFVPIPYLSAAIDSAPLVSYPLILYLIPVMTLAPPQTKPPEKLADAPFDDAQADLILQSSDEVPTHFRVFKNILSLASPVFGDMFTLPSPPSENPHDEVQVVPLSEDSITLDIALRHIYPLRRTQPSEADNLRYARILAEFARKYQVEGLDQFIKGYLKDSLECDPATDPVGVYAIAVTYGYNDIGRSAAHTCLTLPFYDLRSPYLPCATLEHILELLRYHVACGEAASNLASSDRSWLSSLVLAEDITSKRGSRMCSQCTVTDFTSQTSSKSRGPRFNNYNSDDDDEHLLISRKSPSPAGCVDLFASFGSYPSTSPGSRCNYRGSFCVKDQ